MKEGEFIISCDELGFRDEGEVVGIEGIGWLTLFGLQTREKQ